VKSVVEVDVAEQRPAVHVDGADGAACNSHPDVSGCLLNNRDQYYI
jgi:hypothetical protein